MPRSGGESDKLGNRYEGLWTIGRLLELAAGKSNALMVEPPGDDALGVEFVVRLADGTREFHSAKRQRSKGEWSLAALARPDNRGTGRSILKDLYGKLAAKDVAACWFVSGTGANDIRELSERARRRNTSAEFENHLTSPESDTLRSACERHLLPVTSSWQSAYEFLRRLHVVLIDEATLARQVDQQIAHLVYRADSREFSEVEVRTLLGDFVLDHLGSDIGCDAVWEHLAAYGYAHRDWAADPTIRGVVRDWNRTYVRTVEGELINGARICREQARTIVDEVSRIDGPKTIRVSAPAGVGKSCVLAQAVDVLESRGVPVLVVRMDRHGEAHTTRDLGRQMGLPRSPAIVLRGLAGSRLCTLVVDQLDAASQVSGRYPHLWEAFDSLCREAAMYSNVRVVLACRDFDLQNDHRLRKLRLPDAVKHIPIGLLAVEDVDAAMTAAGCPPARLSLHQKDVLRTPLHLHLFLEGIADDLTEVGFAHVGHLYDRYWEHKETGVALRLGHKGAWTEVIDRLCDWMSRNLTLYAPSVIVDDWRDTVAAMLTEHVVVRDDCRLRFFHESFFDYAFARRFCGRSESLIELLRSGEQHLFRRSQVRQVLAYVRDHDRPHSLVQLREILTDPGVRFHIKRLVLAWLGTLNDPTPDEWRVVEPLLGAPDLHRHAAIALRNSLPWFDLLEGLGVVRRWLESPDDSVVNRGL